jgi:hypothetical protein
MTELSYETPAIGEEFSKAAPKADTAFENIRAWANGKVDSSNLKPGGIKEESLENKAVGEGKLSEAVQTRLGEKGTGLVLTNKYTNKFFTKGECEAGVEPSKTRPALVNMRCETFGSATLILVGGEPAGEAGAAAEGTATVFVPAGQKWIAGQAMHVYTMLL